MVTKPKSIEDAADQALGAENVADFQTQLATLRADIAGLADILSAMSRNGSEQVRQAVAEAYAEMKSKGGDGFAQAEAKAKATDAVESVADYASKNPLQSLGIAAGVGMLLGLLFGRR